MAHAGFQAMNGAVAINAVSPTFETKGFPHITVIGTTSAAAIITLQLSEDGTTWVDDVATASGTTHKLHATVGTRYARVRCSAAVTATIWISANSSQ